ncbi:hypothetical protein NA57DRAFT_62638 [Rhizodiscina lignyota]|uniref:Translation initiation factor eIF2B subunit gamma n=1 Tax=Rhizodiscina lignyota TaxID=1504668 RepID=A0A9P4IPM7_9PEZI|nr:hypothetical protein NA57DRAFT_62638 [Rhizodiscina lignyota]
MPHATVPSPGFQAFILCGPGVSLNTFTSNPKDFPKALVPIANRPMVWYPLEWCYRMGVTNIQLITPPESAPALEAALSQNPHLTSLPAPKPDVLAPEDLTQTTGTGEIFRLPEVQEAITGDFIVLPCDLICELDGSELAEAWMIQEGGLGAASGGIDDDGVPIRMGIGGEKSGRRGGLGVWYETKGEGAVKGQETDFIATTPLPASTAPTPTGSLRPDISKLAYAMPTDTLKDISEEKKGFPIRHALLKKHGRIKMLMTHRDAHIYLFPYWVAQMMAHNDKFDSLSEDVVGWWAKAGWQDGLGEKLGLRGILQSSGNKEINDSTNSNELDDEVDVAALSTTQSKPYTNGERTHTTKLASRAQDSSIDSLTIEPPLQIPPILAYVQPSDPSLPFIRRVDTATLLLSISLRLAKLPSMEDAKRDNKSPSPLAHAAKIAHPDALPKQGRVEAENSLLAENVQVGERATIKESVVGTGCTIGSGALLQRCLLMEGAIVGENCRLSDCILGRRCKITGGPRMDEEKTDLRNCEVQEGNVVPWGTDAKNEKFMVFEGLSDEEPSSDDDAQAVLDDLDGDGQMPISER